MAKSRSKSKSTPKPAIKCPPLPTPASAAEALRELKAGNKRYLDMKEQPRCNSDRRKRFHYGQEPWVVVLTCADSRVSPELIFDAGIGELFVVRVAGNIANACSIASIEYAVDNLPVRAVVVLGHENCGAVNAALARGCYTYNLNQLLGHLGPVADQYACEWENAKGDKRKDIELAASRYNTREIAKQLKHQSEILLNNDDVAIIPAVYETGSGKVKWESKRSWQ